MRYLVLILFTIFVIVNSSCSDRVEKKQLILKGKVEFVFPGYSGLRYSGTMTYDNNELFYFANVESNKKIDFFYNNGQHFSSVNVSPITSSGEKIESILCISLDTIFVKTAINGNVYCLDRNGLIWKRIRGISTWKDGEEFESTSTITNNNFYLNRKFIFHCIPAFPTDESLSMTEALSKQADVANKKPYFLNVENWWQDSAQYSFSIPNFYCRFIDSGYINMEPPLYACSDSNAILFSVYSDRIYKANKSNTGIEKDIRISSRYTPIGIKPIPVTTEHFGDALNNMAQRGGMIINVTYDKYRKQYYVSVRHKASSKENTGQHNSNRWSIIILDPQLNFKEEILMEAGKYNPGDIIVSKDGIYIYKNNDELLPQKIEFDVFHIKSS